MPTNQIEVTVPVTRNNIKKKNLGDNLQHLQIFNSDQIVLERVIASGQTEITYGKVITRDSLKIDQVVIRAGEKGEIMQQLSSTRYIVCFDENPNLLLTFEEDPSAGIFFLVSVYEKDQIGKYHARVQYGDYKYWVIEGQKRKAVIPREGFDKNGKLVQYQKTEIRGAHIMFDYVKTGDTEITTTFATGREVK
jgi:hypothetical protein